jgi:nucleotide-binding universal stress UspA family protein
MNAGFGESNRRRGAMKSILLHMNDDAEMQGRMQAALDLARAFDGHVTCLQAVSYEVFAPGDIYGSTIAAAIPAIKQAAEEFRARMEADLANEGVSWEWIFAYGMAEHRLLEYSALQDVVVVGPRDIGMDEARPSRLVGDLVLRGRTPVLVVPGDQKGFDATGPVLVGWNGASEAAIALRAALPLLEKASAVYLASVSEENERDRYDFPPVSGAEYLSRHGIECEMVDIPRGEAPIGEALSSAAQMRKCTCMVMGAYGHSRLAELLLGGVTRQALTDPQLPILLAH